jgi:citrate synthase
VTRTVHVDSSVYVRPPTGTRFLSASEAAERLGVKRATLYAYVARGHLRGLGATRAGGHVYSEDDVERLRTRAAARKGHAGAASGALRFGEPVLSSSITRIDPRGPAYRGVLATQLVDEGRPFEAALELLIGTSARPVGAPPRALAAALRRAAPHRWRSSVCSRLTLRRAITRRCSSLGPRRSRGRGL